ncbi:MAG: hypothetical protein J0H08_05060, partial [Rhizobiales bacterium]|nr:hypothetical protein [Hyphomicrobiales bacterium]
MKIFIAGCARSGTTVSRRLMASFADTHVHPEEAGADMLDSLEPSAKHVVVKRKSDSYLTLPRLAAEIGLIYCVRHPFDVLTSVHPEFPERRFYVSELRWRAEYAAYHMLKALQPRRRIFVLRYEDTVLAPDATQRRMAEHFGLEIAETFSGNAAGVPIRTTSLDKWRSDPVLRDYLDTFDRPFLRAIGAFCAEFGYPLPARYGRWFPAAIRTKPWRAVARARSAPRVSRLAGNPIIRPDMLPGTLGANINGPSLIRAPD